MSSRRTSISSFLTQITQGSSIATRYCSNMGWHLISLAVSTTDMRTALFLAKSAHLLTWLSNLSGEALLDEVCAILFLTRRSRLNAVVTQTKHYNNTESCLAHCNAELILNSGAVARYITFGISAKTEYVECFG